jgi:hypothetical protein
MASPRTRKIRKLKVLQRMAPAQVAAPQPTLPVEPPAPEPAVAPEPVVIEMVEETAPEETLVEVDMASEVDYSSMTKAELCEVLDERGVEYSRYATKADLVELAEG